MSSIAIYSFPSIVLSALVCLHLLVHDCVSYSSLIVGIKMNTLTQMVD